jgi:hypothetical protein
VQRAGVRDEGEVLVDSSQAGVEGHERPAERFEVLRFHRGADVQVEGVAGGTVERRRDAAHDNEVDAVGGQMG